MIEQFRNFSNISEHRMSSTKLHHLERYAKQTHLTYALLCIENQMAQLKQKFLKRMIIALSRPFAN